MLRTGLIVITALLFLYMFHWKLLTPISAIFCYYVWKDQRTRGRPPILCYQSSSALCLKIIHSCKILTEKYSPPLLWGTFGHVQTLLYGIYGRFGVTQFLSPDRRTVVAADGTTVYYDIFHPDNDSNKQYSHIMLVCPGIGSHSGTKYLQVLVQHATSHGYCVVVKNYVGALDHTLTGHRIFSYGGTGDLALIYERLKDEFPGCKFVGVGFSLGANILLKFLGECPERQDDFVCAISACQGYDAVKAILVCKDSWNNLYNYAITKANMDLIKQHHHQLLLPMDTIQVAQTNFRFLANLVDRLSVLACLLLSNHQIVDNGRSPDDRDYDELVVSRDCDGFPLDRSSCEPVDVKSLSQAQITQEVDEYYTRRVMGFRSIHELYKWSSCGMVMHKIKTLPMLLVNARDDPMIWEELLSIPADYTKHNPNAIFLCTDHGGHLGFFEGGSLIIPNTISWIDRVIVDYTTAVLQYSN